MTEGEIQKCINNQKRNGLQPKKTTRLRREGHKRGRPAAYKKKNTNGLCPPYGNPPLLMAKPTALAVCRYDRFMRPVGDRPKKREPLKSLFSKAEGFLCNGGKMRQELIHFYLDHSKAFRFAPIFAQLR